jgi:hypothetical protein
MEYRGYAINIDDNGHVSNDGFRKMNQQDLKAFRKHLEDTLEEMDRTEAFDNQFLKECGIQNDQT